MILYTAGRFGLIDIGPREFPIRFAYCRQIFGQGFILIAGLNLGRGTRLNQGKNSNAKKNE
jgi:hypothetical protein